MENKLSLFRKKKTTKITNFIKLIKCKKQKKYKRKQNLSIVILYFNHISQSKNLVNYQKENNICYD